jgi:hypothetical protein
VLGISANRLGEGFYLAIPADDALRTGADALAYRPAGPGGIKPTHC